MKDALGHGSNAGAYTGDSVGIAHQMGVESVLGYATTGNGLSMPMGVETPMGSSEPMGSADPASAQTIRDAVMPSYQNVTRAPAWIERVGLAARRGFRPV
jgi:hypothetical protein